MTDASPLLTVGFVLLQRFTLLPFAAFVDCLRLAADEGDRSRQLRCHWRFMTSDGQPASSSCGAAVSPCEPFADPTRFDYLVVIGGVQDEHDRTDRVALDYLRRAAAAGVPLVGVCTGVFALIQAGVMPGRRCCVSWYHHGDLTRRFPAVTPVADRLFVDDGDVITCAGGSAAADLAAYLVERHLGRAWAMKSLHIMLIDEGRRGEHPSRSRWCSNGWRIARCAGRSILFPSTWANRCRLTIWRGASAPRGAISSANSATNWGSPHSALCATCGCATACGCCTTPAQRHRYRRTVRLFRHRPLFAPVPRNLWLLPVAGA
ncbi:transcriptional activator FtrA [Serratia rubidaea]|uniref:Transcriptional activator FtrA n=1 Tax=Serratia rubidaea TaxID=61652 RepID=A0A447QFC3_SERRU|nr:transcriptional activator FtrA [Serratia rubidaea]